MIFLMRVFFEDKRCLEVGPVDKVIILHQNIVITCPLLPDLSRLRSMRG